MTAMHEYLEGHTDEKAKRPPKFLSYREMRQFGDDIKALEGRLAQPNSEIQDKIGIAKTLNRMRTSIASQMAPKLTGDGKDVATKRMKELDVEIREGMLSAEEMRRNPAGAATQHITWENRNKWNIQERRNLLIMLDRENSDPDYLSLARMRPHTSHLDMHDAQIPRQRMYGFSNEAYKRNYDDAFPSERSRYEEEARSVLERVEDLQKKLEERMNAEGASTSDAA